MAKNRIERVIPLEGYHESFLETMVFSQNVQMLHNGTVETRPVLRTFLSPSQIPISISLPDGTRCVAYSYQFPQSAIFGKAPLTWSCSNNPPCTTMTSGGLLSGSPCKAGDFVMQVVVDNAYGQTTRFKVKIHIADSKPIILLPGES